MYRAMEQAHIDFTFTYFTQYCTLFYANTENVLYISASFDEQMIVCLMLQHADNQVWAVNSKSRLPVCETCAVQIRAISRR